MKKIIIAIDSFKGCLSSEEAEKAVETGIKSVFPDCETLCIPIADGGEGLLEVLVKATQGEYISLQAHDPLFRIVPTRYGISGDRQTAILEMASIDGLPLLSASERNPLLTTSYGTGELIRDALEKGYRNFILGIGGSATNDAGLGLLQALGFRFLDSNGDPLGQGGQILSKVATIDSSSVHPALKETRFTIACDVDNPFYGLQGATRIYAPQKGADARAIRILEEGMQSLAKIIHRTTGRDISEIPGGGAAGGIGGSMIAFLNARLIPGIQLVLEIQNFQKHLQNADLVITGEGRMDKQTLRGKVPFGILKAARKQQIPVIALTGHLENTEQLNNAGFEAVFPILPCPASLQEAMNPEFTRANLQRSVTQLCRLIRNLEKRSQ